MNQLELFGPRIARRGDPITSQVAAVEIAPELGRLQQIFVERLTARGCPSTANEIAQGDESIRKRAKELVERRRIRVMETAICSVTGKYAQLYWITEGGDDHTGSTQAGT